MYKIQDISTVSKKSKLRCYVMQKNQDETEKTIFLYLPSPNVCMYKGQKVCIIKLPVHENVIVLCVITDRTVC